MYLGPVVAAQQVLDPSPQTSYPRKEKKGGTSEDYLLRMFGKVFFSFISVTVFNMH